MSLLRNYSLNGYLSLKMENCRSVYLRGGGGGLFECYAMKCNNL
jgi:hypothetical protein